MKLKAAMNQQVKQKRHGTNGPETIVYSSCEKRNHFFEPNQSQCNDPTQENV